MKMRSEYLHCPLSTIPDNLTMGNEKSDTMTSVYSDTSDQYMSFIKSDSLLLGTKQLSNGTTDPPTYSDQVQLTNPLTFGEENNEYVFVGEEASGEETGGGETTETESKHSDEEDWLIVPPEDYLEQVQGYEMVTFDTVIVPPPADIPEYEKTDEEKIESSCSPSPPPALLPQAVVTLTDQQAQSALLSYVSTHCCYGSGAAKQMRITSKEYVPAHHYELQTFTEKRETSWTFTPHKGDSQVDGPGGGQAPLPWEIEEQPSSLFKDEVRVGTVPHTGVVKTCHKCRGTGGMICRDCAGKGWVRCLHCHGDVYLPDGDSMDTDRDRCYYCQHSKHGHGHMECEKCQAKGKVSCATCEGTTHIRSFIQLSISWRVVTAEHIDTKLSIPENFIRNASGQVAFEEEKPKVVPVDAFKDEVIKMASAQLVASHASKFPDEKILRQRHQVRVVPVTKVNYEWKGRSRSFFVYGYENKVHLPNNSYPQSCCWGCSLM